MISSIDFLKSKPREFIRFIKKRKIARFYFVFDHKAGKAVGSHPQLQFIADFFNSDKRDFLEHEGLFFQLIPQYDVLLGAFIHKTNRGQAAGGLRYWEYDSIEDFFRDGVRLSKGMTRKNALAGLWWGGGKGIITRNPELNNNDLEIRASIYKEYGQFISSLKGSYVTAEDVGTKVQDMANVFSKTRFTTCIPEEWGGSGNPSKATAKGVSVGMEAALQYNGQNGIEGKTIAVQGAGNVGSYLIEFLFRKKAQQIIVSDINLSSLKKLKEKFNDQKLQIMQSDENDVSIFKADVDVFSPNALGAVLNPNTISLLKAKIVCGAANNQLEDNKRDDKLLFEKNILYVPDFLTNRMGIVQAANEQYGYVNNDPSLEKHLSKEWDQSIYQTVQRVFKEALSTKKPTAQIALRMADRLSLEEHPIFGHRGRLIIDSLVEENWHDQTTKPIVKKRKI